MAAKSLRLLDFKQYMAETLISFAEQLFEFLFINPMSRIILLLCEIISNLLTENMINPVDFFY